MFFEPEQREVKCEKCFFETTTQSMEIIRVPKCLIIHLKRFITEVNNDFSVTVRKNQAAVLFEEYVDLDDLYDDNSLLTYRLRSSVHHIGNTATCGHYTADTLSKGSWYRYNDSYVTQIECTDALGEHSQKRRI